MDKQIQAVLADYHERIQAEREGRGSAPQGPDWRNQAFLAVGPETGQLINILARSLRAPHILELGTSFGYSGIWLAEAARSAGGRVTTVEQQAHKSAFARDKAVEAGLAEYIDFHVGDALALIDSLPPGIDFVLVDLWKDLYVPCLERFYPKLNPGAIIVADNIIRPGGDDVRRYASAVRRLPGITSILLPVGSGLEVSRYQPA